jgi:MFS family permease
VLVFHSRHIPPVLNLGAGGGGPDAAHVNDIVAACLYSIFAVMGFFGGSTLNTIGPRYTMMIGAFGYGFYITGHWYFDYKASRVYAIIGGCVLGYIAGLLWTASNYVAFCYSGERDKGKFYAIQGLLTTFSNLIAACVVMGISFNDPTLSGVPQSVYATFFSLMMLAIVVAWFLCKPEEVGNADGKPIAIFKESWWHEIKGITALFKELKTWMIFPALLCVENSLVLKEPLVVSEYPN